MSVTLNKVLGPKNFYKRPVFLFVVIYLIILFFPALYLNITEQNDGLFIYLSKSEISKIYNQNLLANVIFLCGMLLSVASVSTMNTVRLIRGKFKISERTIKIIFYCSATICVLYFLRYGISKLGNLGTDLSGKDFRRMGFDDVPIFWALSLEFTRKVIFPFLLVYFYASDKKQLFWSSTFFFLLAATATLDRFPFLIALIFWFYVSYQSSSNFLHLILKLVIMVLILGFVASILTYVQHNQINIELNIILLSAIDFLLHRVLLIPTYAATEIGFHYADIHGFFNLRYSRLGYLIGNARIGFDTAGADPYFVAPVGVVADTYRNFGYIGVLVVSVFLGWFVAQFSKISSTNTIHAMRGKYVFVKGFMIINLATYLVFGNFFTMGVFSVLLSMIVFQNCKFKGIN